MATSLSNATFPLDSVLELMEQASRPGLKGKDALKKYASFWDLVGDATGDSAIDLAKAAARLKAVGIAAGQESELLSAFGLITSQTSSRVGEFINFVSRLAPEMTETGASVDDAAVIMTALETELGLTARVAQQELKQAITESTTGLAGVIEALGLSEEQMLKHRDALSGSQSVIEANAEAHTSTTRPSWRNFSQHWGTWCSRWVSSWRRRRALPPSCLQRGR